MARRTLHNLMLLSVVAGSVGVLADSDHWYALEIGVMDGRFLHRPLVFMAYACMWALIVFALSVRWGIVGSVTVGRSPASTEGSTAYQRFSEGKKTKTHLRIGLLWLCGVAVGYSYAHIDRAIWAIANGIALRVSNPLSFGEYWMVDPWNWFSFWFYIVLIPAVALTIILIVFGSER